MLGAVLVLSSSGETLKIGKLHSDEEAWVDSSKGADRGPQLRTWEEDFCLLGLPYCQKLLASNNYFLLWTNKTENVLEHLPNRQILFFGRLGWTTGRFSLKVHI
jgi:hypothetical protein